MFSNLSKTSQDDTVSYPITDSKLPFADYIARSRAIIEARRTDLTGTDAQNKRIIDANCPYELRPQTSSGKAKHGALLIHGLLDCPFSLRDIGQKLQSNGVLCRSILLPGHGTKPSDLLYASYHEWIQAVRYGIESMREEVDQLYLIGYSTGATLSVYQALQDAEIAGVVLLSPAIRIKAPVDIAVAWHKLSRYLRQENKLWLYREPENDYAKYQSITFNAVSQVAQLTQVIRELNSQHALTCPVYMAISREDETISSHQAIDFFARLPNQDSRMLLYTSIEHAYPDSRIVTRMSQHPKNHIKHYSHVSIPFSPLNIHYGVNGDYEMTAHRNQTTMIYGAYNRIEQRIFDFLHRFNLTGHQRRELTYNPDFDFMAADIAAFITR